MTVIGRNALKRHRLAYVCFVLWLNVPITNTCPCNTQRFFSETKIKNFHWKNVVILNIFDQNIDCGYILELPLCGSSNGEVVLTSTHNLFWIKNENQRTNGPVNAHLRSAAYTNKHV